MQCTIVITLLVAFSTSSMIAPADGDGILNVYESLLEGSQKQKSNNYACVDFYSMTCNETNNNNINQPKYKDQLEHLYSSQVYNTLIDILNDDVENEKDPINVERKLFQSCMSLGTDDINVNDTNEIENNSVNSDENKTSEKSTEDTEIYTMEGYFHDILQLFDQKIDEANWQKLDQKLASLGFKHSFFEIDVVKDPEAPNKNIIRLSPPSMKEWNFKKLTDVISDIFTQIQLNNLDYCKKDESSDDNSSKKDLVAPDNDSAFLESKDTSEHEISISDDDDEESTAKPSPELPAICGKLLMYTPETLTSRLIDRNDQKVMDLLNKILQGIFDTMDILNKDSKVKRFSIKDWNTEYNKSVKGETAKIDWSHVLKSYFKNAGIYVGEKDYVLVENLPYFYKMAKFFNDTTNEVIVHVIRSKFVGENMRYWAWDYVYDINPVDKSAFCLEQNQFYAASAEVLKRLKLKMKSYNMKVESLLYGIADVLHSNISSAKLSEIENSYLLSNLKDFTKNPFEIVNDSVLSEYYKNFEVTGEYVVDINHYKSLMRKINLKKLHDNAIKHHRSSPFSVLEIQNPRNRYIMNSALNAIIYKDKFLQNKAAVYSTFGVKSVSFLFSLLAEKTYENDLRDFRGILSIIPRVSYNPEYVSCFLQESSVKYGYPAVYDIITEVFSVRFAYEALLLNQEKSESTEEFFTVYTEDHCRENDKQMIKKILSNVAEFANAFECLRNENTICHLKAF